MRARGGRERVLRRRSRASRPEMFLNLTHEAKDPLREVPLHLRAQPRRASHLRSLHRLAAVLRRDGHVILGRILV